VLSFYTSAVGRCRSYARAVGDSGRLRECIEYEQLDVIFGLLVSLAVVVQCY
jgi:hypothetical protein